MAITIRAATPADAPLVFDFIRALADYEQLADQVVATPADIAAALFGPSPKVFCDLAFLDNTPAGFALWYYSYSTFLGKHGLYLEDLFVDPAHRGQRIGKALLRHLARRCVSEGLQRFEWEVLDWNQPAIDFYEAQGAVLQKTWIPVRVTGAALEKLAGPAP